MGTRDNLIQLGKWITLILRGGMDLCAREDIDQATSHTDHIGATRHIHYHERCYQFITALKPTSNPSHHKIGCAICTDH